MTARPVDGAATEQALALVAQALGVRRSAVGLVTGRTARDKVVEVDGPVDEIRRTVDRLRGGGQARR